MNPFSKIHPILAHKGLFPLLEAFMERIPDKAKILSVGSGGRIGTYITEHGAARGWTVTSFDIDEDRNPDIAGDITSHDFGRKKFDAIIMSEVLEHVKDPQAAVNTLHKTVKKGGVVIVSTPFIFPIHDRPHDYYRYTHYGLRHLFRDFASVDIQARNSWAESINVLLARITVERDITCKLFSPIAVTLAFVLQPLMWALGKVIKTDNMTSGYVMIAKK